MDLNNFTFDHTPENFDQELFESYERYFSDPDAEFKFNFIDANGTKNDPSIVFKPVFEEWGGIMSKWDRMSVFYRFWDKTEFNKLQKWQKLERYIKDRQGLKALDFFKTNITNEDFIDVRVLIAASKLHRILLLNDKAKYFAEAAYKLNPDLNIVKAEYATVLHVSESEFDNELSHKFMNEVLEDKITRSETKEIPLLNYFAFSKEYIDSSVFTVLYLNMGNCGLDTWKILSEEYYYCPIFRYEHALKLANTGNSLFAMAKLCTLSGEFPWFKRALVATIANINKIRIEKKDPEFMKEELIRLKHDLSLNQ